MLDRQALKDILHALYMLVAVLERAIGKSPTTKELRDRARRERRVD
jgi:hypothetical protein